MLQRPVVHELDSNAVFLRKHEISLHHRKLGQIRNRKNQFESESTTALSIERFVKMKKMAEKLNPNAGYHKSMQITRNNKYLADKINKIETRTNQTLLPDILTEIIETKSRFNKSIRHLKSKQLLEDNIDFNSRLKQRESFINFKKINEDHLLHQKIHQQLRRIKPISNQACDKRYTEAVYLPYTNSSNDRMKFLPPKLNKIRSVPSMSLPLQI